MAILRQLLVHAATKLTSDPRIRAKAADVLEHEVKPRAAVAWSHTRPKLEAARDNLIPVSKSQYMGRVLMGLARASYLNRDHATFVKYLDESINIKNL